MLTINELKQRSPTFSNASRIELPKPEQLVLDKIDAYKEAGLTRQLGSELYQLRQWQAEKLGFTRLEERDIFKLLTGYDYTGTGRSGGWAHRCEWFYDYLSDQVETSRIMWPLLYGHNIVTNSKSGVSWSTSKTETVSVIRGCLNNLTTTIPYGVALTLNECKKLKLFNCFMAFAPEEAWISSKVIDPIVVGSICHLAPHPLAGTIQKGPYVEPDTRIEAFSHYFIAQW